LIHNFPYFRNILIAIAISNTAKPFFNVVTGSFAVAFAPSFEVKNDVVVLPETAVNKSVKF